MNIKFGEGRITGTMYYNPLVLEIQELEQTLPIGSTPSKEDKRKPVATICFNDDISVIKFINELHILRILNQSERILKAGKFTFDFTSGEEKSLDVVIGWFDTYLRGLAC